MDKAQEAYFSVNRYGTDGGMGSGICFSLRSNGGMSARAGAEMVKAIGFLLRGDWELRIMGASGIAERDLCIIEKKGYRNCREIYI